MLEQSIAWFAAHKGQVTYSMINRNGPNSFDCSSAVYHALISAGNFPSTISIGNTDTLFNDLERHGWTQVAELADGSIPTQRGDVFIWGARGASSGAVGHTGQYIDADNIIHCCYGYNGIAISNHDWLWSINGKPPVTIYRYTGSTATPAGNPTDQIIETGSWIRFTDTYTADNLQAVGNAWQIQTNALCSTGFTWDDNGIPAGLATEVDADGYATTDQELAIGSLYKIPGKFIVMDFGQTNGEWMAQIGFGGLTFWVDVATVTEISDSDPGTPTPSQRQINADVPSALPPVTPTPVVAPLPVITSTPVVDIPAPEVVPIVTPKIATVETPVLTPVVTPPFVIKKPVKKATIFSVLLESFINLFVALFKGVK